MIELKKKMITYDPRKRVPEIEYEILNLPPYIQVEFDKQEGNYNGTIKSVTMDGEARLKLGHEKSFEIMNTIMNFNREIIDTNVKNRIEFAPRVKRI